jgi:hypothetical protein
MAIIKGAIQMTGGIKGVSFYSLRGSDKVFMRTKGGATKNQIAKSPKFEGLRKQQKEFSGCAKFGSLARYAFGGLHRLADYNLTPVLIGIGKNLMKLDTVSPVGTRDLKLTTYKAALEGFNFNRNYPFNTILRSSPSWELDRDMLQAVVTVPRINTEIDLLNVQKLPFFRLIIVVGTISDMVYDPAINDYKSLVFELHGASATVTGEWNSTQTILPGHTMTAQMAESQIAQMTDDVTVLLSMAVEFGNVGFTGDPVEVKYAGCGKVLAVE